MDRNLREALGDLATSRTIIAALIALVIGIGLVAYSVTLESEPLLKAIVAELGSLVLVTVVVTILFDLFARRAFFRHIQREMRAEIAHLRKVQFQKYLSLDEETSKMLHLAEDVHRAGIMKVTESLSGKTPWSDYFRSVRELDIFFTYGSSWTAEHIEALRDVAARPGARIRLFIVDPDDEHAMAELVLRAQYIEAETKTVQDEGYNADQLKQRIRNTIHHFEGFHRKNGAQIEIWTLHACPVFSFYRFDDVVILDLYSHRREKGHVPRFICGHGRIYDFVNSQIESFTIGNSEKGWKGLAKRVFPKQPRSTP